jgi:hypothetical protein
MRKNPHWSTSGHRLVSREQVDELLRRIKVDPKCASIRRLYVELLGDEPGDADEEAPSAAEVVSP